MAPTRKPDGRVARRHGTREAIMDAATELFAARGVTSTSIEEIAEAAGIAKGSIYYNFESKAGLVEAIMERNGSVLAASLGAASAGLSGVQLRVAVVRTLLAVVQQHSAAASVMVTELFRTERSWRESIHAWRAIALDPLVADLVADGVSREDADLQAATITGATLTAGLEWLVFHPDRSYEEVTRAVLAMLRLD